ncbi:helix-turn-helix domain-containing protein [Cellulomonas endophytica]|uniref:helix-turn-helix domain-containing protein n=1 Tax=Cellulomonas endophytica TaxID=2494735 RepID=UPI0010115E75|nr:helix-turn-helix domain-containing protein [Cellulomonas endophytica]
MAVEYSAVTPEEVAETLGISSWWVREQARRGRIPHLRFGRGRIRLLPEHVDALIRLATVEGRPAEPQAAPSASADLRALGATVRSLRAHEQRPHVAGDPPLC